MAPAHHNPGRAISLNLSGEPFTGFSISALATYILAPQLNAVFDLGECPLDAVPLERVFISHAHGDHTRCLLRHESLRRLMGMAPATYFIPAEIHEGMRELSRAWKKLERVPPSQSEEPRFHPMRPGDTAWLHRQLAVKAFQVSHSLPSRGYTLYDVRKKLKPEYQGTPGRELARMRREGVAFEEEVWKPRLTYIGDSTIETLYRERHVGESQILFIEVTFLMEDEREIARRRGHTHLDELVEFLREQPDTLQNEHIVLKHFSMRYERRYILHALKSRLPAEFQERMHVLI